MKTLKTSKKHVAHALLAGAVVLLTACATPEQAPTEQLAVSRATIDQAVSAGASEFSPVQLNSARGKIDRANVAMGAQEYGQARVLAEQAQVDAQLAITRTRSSKAQRAASALQEDRRVLRDEIDRNAK